MIDYKATLNLPDTSFPMRADLANRELQWLQYWQSIDIYQKLISQTDRPLFILHDGPPYANGDIHLGHALNKILKDIIIKTKILSGCRAPYVPGWDCHGLPIELNVEKKLGSMKKTTSAAAFRQACREYAQSQIQNQAAQFQRLGILADWENPYVTMDFTFEANIVRTLQIMIRKGYLQRGYKPVHWCVDCSSALAEAEIEYLDKQSPAIYVRFKAVEPQRFWACCPDWSAASYPDRLTVVIWTTTPWTLPANQALAVHPELEYVIISCLYQGEQECFFLAKELLDTTMAILGITEYQVQASCSGSVVEGLLVHHPFLERSVPIVLGKHVTTEIGSGVVHTAPGHGLDDYHLGLQYHLPVDHAVQDDGCFHEATPFVGGKHVTKANEVIIEVLRTQGTLLQAQTIVHSYPHCWRHKTPLIFRGTPQWFINMKHQDLQAMALKAIKSIQWLPEWGEARMAAMVENRPDWCVSRQRTWGVPIPVFVHRQTGNLHPETDKLLDTIAAAIEQQGIEGWYELKTETLLGDEADEYQRSTDILDVWFDSGATFACVLQSRSELSYPADIYLEGSDQYRGWFQSSLINALCVTGQAPFRQIITHGFTIDEQGRKMSKSLGNVIGPSEITKQYGADILRLWTASTDYRAEMSISEQILKRITDVYRRIRNTARYLLANLNGFDPMHHLLPHQDLLALDQWAVSKAAQLQQEVITAYDEYQFHIAIQKIHHFCAVEMGSFYLDIIKDRQYTTAPQSRARRSAQTAMFHIIEALCRWLAPVLTFTAEEISKSIPGERPASIYLEQWYDALTENVVSKLGVTYWERILMIREQVNRALEEARHRGLIGSALEAGITIYCGGQTYEDLSALGDELRFVLITSATELIHESTENLRVEIWVSPHPKCIRCWHRRLDVGSNALHPELCQRCIENISGSGEVRLFA